MSITHDSPVSHQVGFTTTSLKGATKQISSSKGWRWLRWGRGRLHACALKTAGWQRPPGKGHRPRWPLTRAMITRHYGLSLPDDAGSHVDGSRSPETWTWVPSVTFLRMNKLTCCHNISERPSVESLCGFVCKQGNWKSSSPPSHLHLTCAVVNRCHVMFCFWTGLTCSCCCSEQQLNGCWNEVGLQLLQPSRLTCAFPVISV